MKIFDAEKLWNMLLTEDIDCLEIHKCSDASFIVARKNNHPVFLIDKLCYNSEFIVYFRVFFQNILHKKNVKIATVFKDGISIFYQLIVRHKNKETYLNYASSGISNKYNRLIIKRLIIKRLIIKREGIQT